MNVLSYKIRELAIYFNIYFRQVKKNLKMYFAEALEQLFRLYAELM